MLNKLFLAGLIGIILASCGDDTPPVPPTPQVTPKACFTPSKTFIDSGETVTFVNCSEKEHSWQWNFGGGDIWNEKDAPAKTFNVKPGYYPVSLTVFNTDGTLDDDTIITIVVAARSFNKIVIDRFPLLTAGGSVWDADDGSSADIKMIYGPTGNLKYSTDIFVNAGKPLVINIPPIKIGSDNNGEWTFRLVDDDGGNNQPMTTFSAFLTKPGQSPIELVNTPNYEAHAFFDRVNP